VDAAPLIARGRNAAVFVPPVTEAALSCLQAVTRRPMLVLTPDADRAGPLADALAGAFAVSGLARAEQRLADEVPEIVVAGVPEALALLKRSALKPGAFLAVVIAWPEDLDEEGHAALESVMSEGDKDAQRLILTADTSAAADKLVERYAFKAMSFGLPPAERIGWAPPRPVGPARFVVARGSQMPEARRRILDALHPGKDEDVVIAPCPVDHDAAAALAARAGDGGPVIVADVHQLRWLHSLFTPLTSLRLAGASDQAEQRADAMRARIAHIIESGGLDHELMALGPLFARHDPALVAAAALRLAVPAQGAGAVVPAAPMPGIAKLWVGIGRKDNVKPGDLVGALVNEAKVPAESIGKIEVKDLFCLVDIRSDAIDKAAAGLTGATVRGRRIIARVDRGPAAAKAGGRPPRRGS
jgi:hypothetical protein